MSFLTVLVLNVYEIGKMNGLKPWSGLK